MAFRAIGSERTEASHPVDAHRALRVLEATLGAVSTEAAIVPRTGVGARFVLCRHVSPQTTRAIKFNQPHKIHKEHKQQQKSLSPVWIVALVVHFEKRTLGHAREIVFVQKLATLVLLAQSAQPMLAQHNAIVQVTIRAAVALEALVSLEQLTKNKTWTITTNRPRTFARAFLHTHSQRT